MKYLKSTYFCILFSELIESVEVDVERVFLVGVDSQIFEGVAARMRGHCLDEALTSSGLGVEPPTCDEGDGGEWCDVII